MLVFLHALLMLRAAVVDWLLRRLRGTDLPVDPPPSEGQASAEYDVGRGVVFHPPVYAQRYAAVCDLLSDPRWCGRLEKIVDMGYHDTSFIKYLKEVPGVRSILGVDLEGPLLPEDIFSSHNSLDERRDPLKVVLFHGNAADPDNRLIGCDAVVSIEMVEHMMPHDLERLVHTVFGFIQPWVAIFTTPNADFNVMFDMLPNGFRHCDHQFEWTREQFHEWCSNIVSRYGQYSVHSRGVGPGPPDTAHLGCCTQLALFVHRHYVKREDVTPDRLSAATKNTRSIGTSEVGSWDYESENLHRLYAYESSKVSLKTFSDFGSQCNMPMELAKEYCMTGTDEVGRVIVANTEYVCRKEYHIEDINRRLNCTTRAVRRFSDKTTKLMETVKPEWSQHPEIMTELKQLTEMLNFNRGKLNSERSESVWNNIVWGQDAPFWNQYYTIVKEYEYPMQSKSAGERIVELVSDEIHRAADALGEETWAASGGRLEIDIASLMGVVRHLTQDVAQVRDLLDWNGFELVGDRVVYTHFPSGETDLLPSSNCQHTTESDNTEGNVTYCDDSKKREMSDREEYVQRAIDSKLSSLRTICDEREIAAELKRVVDQLSCLALRHLSAGGGTGATGASGEQLWWMERKLCDLLALAERRQLRRSAAEGDVNSATIRDYIDSILEQNLSLSSISSEKPQDTISTVPEDEFLWIHDSEELLDLDLITREPDHFTSHGDSSSDSANFRVPYKTFRYNVTKNLLAHENARKKFRKMSYATKQRRFRRKAAARSESTIFEMEEAGSRVVTSARSRVQKRRKSYKKKFRRNSKVEKLAPFYRKYTHMTDLTEIDEDNDLMEIEEDNASLSPEVDVYQLSTDTEIWCSNNIGSKPLEPYGWLAGLQPLRSNVAYYFADNNVYNMEQRVKHGVNEQDIPSTSTGRRCVETDAQCDTTHTRAFTTSSTSATTVTADTATSSIRLQNSFTDVNVAILNLNEVPVTSSKLPKMNRLPNLGYGGREQHSSRDRNRNGEVVFHGSWKFSKNTVMKVEDDRKMASTRMDSMNFLGSNHELDPRPRNAGHSRYGVKYKGSPTRRSSPPTEVPTSVIRSPLDINQQKRVAHSSPSARTTEEDIEKKWTNSAEMTSNKRRCLNKVAQRKIPSNSIPNTPRLAGASLRRTQSPKLEKESPMKLSLDTPRNVSPSKASQVNISTQELFSAGANSLINDVLRLHSPKSDSERKSRGQLSNIKDSANKLKDKQLTSRKISSPRNRIESSETPIQRTKKNVREKTTHPSLEDESRRRRSRKIKDTVAVIERTMTKYAVGSASQSSERQGLVLSSENPNTSENLSDNEKEVSPNSSFKPKSPNEIRKTIKQDTYVLKPGTLRKASETRNILRSPSSQLNSRQSDKIMAYGNSKKPNDSKVRLGSNETFKTINNTSKRKLALHVDIPNEIQSCHSCNECESKAITITELEKEDNLSSLSSFTYPNNGLFQIGKGTESKKSPNPSVVEDIPSFVSSIRSQSRIQSIEEETPSTELRVSVRMILNRALWPDTTASSERIIVSSKTEFPKISCYSAENSQMQSNIIHSKATTNVGIHQNSDCLTINDSNTVFDNNENNILIASSRTLRTKENSIEKKIPPDIINIERNLRNIVNSVILNKEHDSEGVHKLFGRDILANPSSFLSQFSGFSINNIVSLNSQITSELDSSMDDDITRKIASEELLMTNHASTASCRLQEENVPAWLYSILNSNSSELSVGQEAGGAGGGADGGGGAGERAGAVEAAGAGDGRGVHANSSLSEDYSSSLLSSEASPSSDATLDAGVLGSLHLDGLVRAAPGDGEVFPDPLDSSDSSIATVTRVRRNEALRPPPPSDGAAPAPPASTSASGVDADISSDVSSIDA